MKEIWQQVVDAHSAEQRGKFLARVLRTRRRFIPIGLNGRIYPVRRAVLRDYLRAQAD